MSTKKTSWILDLVDQVSAPMRDISKNVDETTKDARELQKEFDELGGDINKTGDEAKQAGKEMGGMFDGLGNESFDMVENGLDSVTAGIYSMIRASVAFIATPVGAAIAVLAGAGLAAREFVKYNEAAREANLLIQQMTKETGPALTDIRVRAQALEKTFGIDIKRSVEIARNNVKAFDITFEEAFDNIEDGLIRGGAANDEFLDSLKEYPRLFANAGFTMQEFQRIVNAGIDEGLYSDKLPDAIKEFSISINEQTQSTRDAMENAFGKNFTDRIFSNIRDGAITPKRALQEIAEEAEKVNLNVQQSQQLTADLFRGAGEDAGGFKEILNGVNIALNEEQTALTALEFQLRRVAQADYDLAEAQAAALESDAYQVFSNELSLVWRKVKTDFFNVVAFITDTVGGMTEWIIKKTFQITTVAVNIPKVFKKAFDDIKTEAMDLVSTFTILADAFNDLLNFRFSSARENFSKFKKEFTGQMGDVIDGITQPAKDLKGLYDKAGIKADDTFNFITDGAVQKNALEKEKEDNEVINPEVTNTGSTFTPTLNDKDFGIAGAGGGSGKSITMNLDITNHFSFAKGDNINLEDIAMQVVGKINERLRDSVIALG